MNVSVLILSIILTIVSYFFLTRPQQGHAKEHREMISRIEAGQKTTTIGRIEGTVRTMDGTAVVITVDDRSTEMTFEEPVIKQVDPS